ncbi:MAG: hypothetical protein U0V70_20850 [Terriglobia bacterium]
MLRESRTGSVREKIHLDLRVKGLNVKGILFEELTQSDDLSEEGISFRLHTPIWINSHLTIENLTPGATPAPMSAMVIRIKTEALDSQLVAARFD